MNNKDQTFTIVASEYAKFIEWDTKHRKFCTALENSNDVTAIGGRLTYSFTPTGLGEIITVSCICGEKIDLTDVGNW
jgi:hypothetical protein